MSQGALTSTIARPEASRSPSESTMQIQCPECGARAEVPDESLGKKAKCPSCSAIFVAEPAPERAPRRASVRGASKSNSTPIAIAVGVGGLMLVGLLMMKSGGSKPKVQKAPPVVKAKEPEPVVETGWNSPMVKVARRVHDAAWTKNKTSLGSLIDAESAWYWKQSSADETETPKPWAALGGGEQAAFLESLFVELIDGEEVDLVSAWNPYDGRVVDETDTDAVVRVDVTPRDGGAEKRTFEWTLKKKGTIWKAASWGRYLTEDELKSARIKRSRKVQKKTLSDGSVVLEAEPTALEHFEDTPQELRDRIDSLYATMIDLELSPRDNIDAQAELREIGRPALPTLLTGLYLTPLDTQDQAIQVNMINQALEQITGQYFGYKPQVAQGSGTGTSEERRTSAIKQWFAWYHRKAKKFTENENVDLLDEALQPTTDKERQELERAIRDTKAAEERARRRKEQP